MTQEQREIIIDVRGQIDALWSTVDQPKGIGAVFEDIHVALTELLNKEALGKDKEIHDVNF